MSRTLHGATLSLEEIDQAQGEIHALNRRLGLPFALVRPPDLTSLDYLFPTLQAQPESLLPESSETVGFLTRLAETMHEAGGTSGLDSTIPSAYTFFGQFLDHDITLELRSSQLADLTDPGLSPLPLAVARKALRNGRSATLDLDSVYDCDPSVSRDGAEMRLSRVSPAPIGDGIRPPGKDDFNDLPRKQPSTDYREDRAAEIGDARNDENLIVAQLHVAFLRAHNTLVRKGYTFDKARELLRQHYQWIAIHDFLKKIVGEQIVDNILSQGNRFYHALTEPFFLPLEFTAAAFRFGHSMVRPTYDFNLNFPQATLRQIFTFTALSGNLVPSIGVGFETLPEHWIIEWERFVEGDTNPARRIDTQIVEPLFSLHNEVGGPLSGPSSLAVRNLLRGYLLRMPTGQALAQALGFSPLSQQEIFEVAPTTEQLTALVDSGFATATPLWFYVLAEAKRGGGNRLGRVGGTIVAEVLIGLVRRSADSILSVPGWAPTLGSEPGKFTLSDLLRLADGGG